MKLTIEPTPIFEAVGGVICRRWEGVSDQGTPVHVWVFTLSPQTHDEAALRPFDEELHSEDEPPTVRGIIKVGP